MKMSWTSKTYRETLRTSRSKKLYNTNWSSNSKGAPNDLNTKRLSSQICFSDYPFGWVFFSRKKKTTRWREYQQIPSWIELKKTPPDKLELWRSTFCWASIRYEEKWPSEYDFFDKICKILATHSRKRNKISQQQNIKYYKPLTLQ